MKAIKTLIFNGSPRVNGDTVSLIDAITRKLTGEYKIVNAYRCNISPCVDCRFCWKNDGCAIDDEMQEVYDYIQECDNILIASPIYFSELTGKLLDVGSRLQTYFCAKYKRKVVPVAKRKKGAVVLVCGGNGPVDRAYETACVLLHDMNCRDVHELVCSHNTDVTPAVRDIQVHTGLNSIVEFFNG